MEKKIIFVSSASSFRGKSIIRFYEKEFFIISYCEHMVPLKETSHIRVNNINKLAKKYCNKTKYIDLFFLNDGLIGNPILILIILLKVILKNQIFIRYFKKNNN